MAGAIDASGTWATRNPLGTSGLPAIGETAVAYRISSPLPDVTGRDRGSFAGRRVLVVGAGHSAANTLISLADLAKEEADTRILWAVRGASAEKVYGGGDLDGLPARGQLGARLRRLVEAGTIELHTGFGIASLKPQPATPSQLLPLTGERSRPTSSCPAPASARTWTSCVKSG